MKPLGIACFLSSRPHYPYDCSEKELDMLGLKVRALQIDRGAEEGHYDLLLKPIQPVEFIYAPVSVSRSITE